MSKLTDKFNSELEIQSKFCVDFISGRTPQPYLVHAVLLFLSFYDQLSKCMLQNIFELGNVSKTKSKPKFYA